MTDWIKPFFVTSVYRSDLLRVSLTQEQAAAFTDEDMLTIAQIMAIRPQVTTSVPGPGSRSNTTERGR